MPTAALVPTFAPTRAPTYAPTGTSCDDALNLAALTSPYTGTTVDGRNTLRTSCGGRGNEKVFYIDVMQGGRLTIGQTSNNYDSRHETRWGGACPGANRVRCTDDPDTRQHSWTNTGYSTQRVFFTIDAYSTGSGSFTLAWTCTRCATTDAPTAAVAPTDGPTDVPTMAPTQGSCDFALNLAALSSPYSGTTADGLDTVRTSCGGRGKEKIFFIDVHAGSTLVIWQTGNSYDSRHETRCVFPDTAGHSVLFAGHSVVSHDANDLPIIFCRWGGSCPGTNPVQCTDDPDTRTHMWRNNQYGTQRVYFTLDAYWRGSGSFTLAWTCTPNCGTTDAPTAASGPTFVPTFLPTPAPTQGSCNAALDLGALSSPYSGTTRDGLMTVRPSCGGRPEGREKIFFKDVAPGGRLVIGQTYNRYDSRHETRWGGACPGANPVQCTDDPDYTQHAWTNDQATEQRVWFTLDAYSRGSGPFTLQWTCTNCEPTHAPTPAPTPAPTEAPTHAPTPAPTHAPSYAPTKTPTPPPTKTPTPPPPPPSGGYGRRRRRLRSRGSARASFGPPGRVVLTSDERRLIVRTAIFAPRASAMAIEMFNLIATEVHNQERQTREDFIFDEAINKAAFLEMQAWNALGGYHNSEPQASFDEPYETWIFPINAPFQFQQSPVWGTVMMISGDAVDYAVDTVFNYNIAVRKEVLKLSVVVRAGLSLTASNKEAVCMEEPPKSGEARACITSECDATAVDVDEVFFEEEESGMQCMPLTDDVYTLTFGSDVDPKRIAFFAFGRSTYIIPTARVEWPSPGSSLMDLYPKIDKHFTELAFMTSDHVTLIADTFFTSDTGVSEMNLTNVVPINGTSRPVNDVAQTLVALRPTLAPSTSPTTATPTSLTKAPVPTHVPTTGAPSFVPIPLKAQVTLRGVVEVNDDLNSILRQRIADSLGIPVVYVRILTVTDRHGVNVGRRQRRLSGTTLVDGIDVTFEVDMGQAGVNYTYPEETFKAVVVESLEDLLRSNPEQLPGVISVGDVIVWDPATSELVPPTGRPTTLSPTYGAPGAPEESGSSIAIYVLAFVIFPPLFIGIGLKWRTIRKRMTDFAASKRKLAASTTLTAIHHDSISTEPDTYVEDDLTVEDLECDDESKRVDEMKQQLAEADVLARKAEQQEHERRASVDKEIIDSAVASAVTSALSQRADQDEILRETFVAEMQAQREELARFLDQVRRQHGAMRSEQESQIRAIKRLVGAAPGVVTKEQIELLKEHDRKTARAKLDSAVGGLGLQQTTDVLQSSARNRPALSLETDIMVISIDDELTKNNQEGAADANDTPFVSLVDTLKKAREEQNDQQVRFLQEMQHSQDGLLTGNDRQIEAIIGRLDEDEDMINMLQERLTQAKTAKLPKKLNALQKVHLSLAKKKKKKAKKMKSKTRITGKLLEQAVQLDAKAAKFARAASKRKVRAKEKEKHETMQDMEKLQAEMNAAFDRATDLTSPEGSNKIAAYKMVLKRRNSGRNLSSAQID